MAKVKEKSVVLEMLELYRNMPYLWDKFHHKYMDKEVRMEGLRVILQVLKKLDPGATIKTVNKKLQNLRSNFSRQHKKVKDSSRTGAGAEEIYKPSLYYYDAMSFLGSSSEPCRPTRDTLESEDLSSLSSDADVESGHQRTPLESNLTKRKKKTPEKNKKKQDKWINAAEELLKSKEEEWEVLGKSIGLQLRDLDKNQSIIAQKLISDVIFYSKSGLLNHSSFIDIGSSVTALPSSSNRPPPKKRSSLHNKYHTTSESQSTRPSLTPSPNQPSVLPQYDQMLSPQASFTESYPADWHGKSKHNTSVPSKSCRNRVLYPRFEIQADSPDLPPQKHSSFIDKGLSETALPSSSNRQPPKKRSSLHHKYHTTSESQATSPTLILSPYHPSVSPQYDQMLSPQVPFTDTHPAVSHGKNKQNTSVLSTSYRKRALYPNFEIQADSSDLLPQNHSSFIDIGSSVTALPSSSNRPPPNKRSSLHNKYHTTSESQSPRPSLIPSLYHSSVSPEYDQKLSLQAPFTDAYPTISCGQTKQNTSGPSTSHRNRVRYPHYEIQADSSDLLPHYQVQVKPDAPPLQYQIQSESANPYPYYQLLQPSSNSHIQKNSSMPFVHYQVKTIDQAPPLNSQIHAYSIVSPPDYQILQYPESLPPHQQKLTVISVPSSQHLDQICSQAPSLDHNIQTLHQISSSNSQDDTHLNTYPHNEIQEYPTFSSSHQHTSSRAQSPDMTDQQSL